MTSKWSSNTLTESGSKPNFDELFKDEYAVLLLQGKNNFGDMIYSYLKVALPNIKSLYATLQAGKGFTPSEFGTVIAAGKGLPSAELRAEISSQYKILDPQKPPALSATPADKKAWDEY
jgi:hypothetical protein